MICTQCHTPVPDHSKFCLACGSLVSDPDLQSAATAAIDEAATLQMENLLREDTKGEFELGPLLGRGGMAAVYLATEVHLSRQVAIKVLPPELTFGHGIERFKREAQIAAALDHPNIIPIHRIASGGKVFWYAMKYLEGEPLDEQLRVKPQFTLDETIDILRQVADALDYAHEHDVIHRDIKPANVLRDTRGRVVVTDFGIAKPLAQATLTASGSIMGTPYYMSPEQGSGKQVSGATDQYALAVMAYEMLCGHRPFDGESAIDIVHKHVMVEPPPLDTLRQGMPEYVYAAIHKGLAKKPEQRFPTVSALVDALTGPWVTADTADTLAHAPLAAVTTATAPTPASVQPSRAETPAAPARKKPPLKGTLVVFAVALLAGASWWWWMAQDVQPPPNIANNSATVPAPAVGPEGGAAEPVTAASGQPQTPAPTAPARPQSEPRTTVTPRPTAPPPPTRGRLTIAGLPDSGTVSIDDRAGSTASNFELNPGRHVLTLAAPGYEAMTDTIEISAGEVLRVRYSGRPVVAPAPPPSEPTPEPAEAAPTASPEPSGPPGVLVVRIRGGWANIFIDGILKVRGRISRPDTLAPGPHVIRIARPGFATVDTTITLEPGQERLITLPLRRVPSPSPESNNPTIR